MTRHTRTGRRGPPATAQSNGQRIPHAPAAPCPRKPPGHPASKACRASPGERSRPATPRRLVLPGPSRSARRRASIAAIRNNGWPASAPAEAAPFDPLGTAALDRLDPPASGADHLPGAGRVRGLLRIGAPVRHGGARQAWQIVPADGIATATAPQIATVPGVRPASTAAETPGMMARALAERSVDPVPPDRGPARILFAGSLRSRGNRPGAECSAASSARHAEARALALPAGGAGKTHGTSARRDRGPPRRERVDGERARAAPPPRAPRGPRPPTAAPAAAGPRARRGRRRR